MVNSVTAIFVGNLFQKLDKCECQFYVPPLFSHCTSSLLPFYSPPSSLPTESEDPSVLLDVLLYYEVDYDLPPPI